MSTFARAVVVVVFALSAAAAASPVVWRDDDAKPIPEPAEDPEGDFIWWDGANNMTFYQAGKVLDLGRSLHTVGEWVGLAGPREAANVNVLDEVPDSTWFTNRHQRQRLSADELARGPNAGPPPALDGPLTVRSGKALGQSPGFVVEDRLGNRYVIKFDPPEIPEMATGAEVVSARIVGALGWNVPSYHIFALDPARLVLAKDATTKDKYRRKRAMNAEDIAHVFERAARTSDGRYRAIASSYIPGKPKGPFATLGVRPDDPNDRVPHEDRRELRGLRAVAAWIHYTDGRRGNTYDTFIPDGAKPHALGHIEHYLLDFSSTLGSGNIAYKSPKDGHEYFVDPPVIGASLFTLGLRVKPWEDTPPLANPALGYFEAATFQPDKWKTTYPNPLFDQATSRDLFWGAKLVSSFTDDDLRTVIAAGKWSDPAAERALFAILRERRQRIAREYFSTERINPIDRFVADGALTFDDLAVQAAVASAESARYKFRFPGGEWRSTSERRIPLDGLDRGTAVEIRTSHDGGDRWSPTTRIELRKRAERSFEITGIERDTND